VTQTDDRAPVCIFWSCRHIAAGDFVNWASFMCSTGSSKQPAREEWGATAQQRITTRMNQKRDTRNPTFDACCNGLIAPVLQVYSGCGALASS
jgi:hypothetical protein